MSVRVCSFIIGVLYLVLGLSGMFSVFIWGPGSDSSSPAVEGDYYYLLGIFASNPLLNCLRAGVGGLLAAYRFIDGRIFIQSVAVLFGVFTLLGFLSSFNSAFGLFPLFGSNLWLHAVTALTAAYISFWGSASIPKIRRMDIGTDKVKVFEDR